MVVGAVVVGAVVGLASRIGNDRRDIVLVQGPAGSGKSLFAWSLYSRFGEHASADARVASVCIYVLVIPQTPRQRPRTL